MAAAVAEDAKVIKMLLLGAGESGKSTIFKQMKIIKSGYDESERKEFRQIIRNNSVESISALLEYCTPKDDEEVAAFGSGAPPPSAPSTRATRFA